MHFIAQRIINFAVDRSAAIAVGKPIPNVGRGIGMAIGLWFITVTASVCTQQVWKTS